MKEETHTPGPWGNNGQSIMVRGLTWLAHAHWDAPQAEANARLIKAAPDMLAALEQVQFGLELLSGKDPKHKGLIQDLSVVRAAISKAKTAASE